MVACCASAICIARMTGGTFIARALLGVTLCLYIFLVHMLILELLAAFISGLCMVFAYWIKVDLVLRKIPRSTGIHGKRQADTIQCYSWTPAHRLRNNLIS